MNEEKFLKAIQFPKESHVLKTLPFKKMDGQLSTTQKKIVMDYVLSRGVRILAILQERNTRIQSYEDDYERYNEIVFLMIKVNDIKKSAQVYKVFAAVMPNPLVVLFMNDTQTKWVFAMHEKKQDLMLAVTDLYEISEVVTIEKVEQQLRFEALVKVNLKAFYKSWIEMMLEMELFGMYNIKRAVSLDNNLVQQLKVKEQEIAYIVGQAKKESQMNKRIELQTKANKLKAEKQALIEKE